MSNLFSNNYIANRPVEKAMMKFATNFSVSQKVIDIGCGYTPYKKFFDCHYVGTDPLESIHPDIVCQAWKIPVDNNSFDGVILNQSLEHISDIKQTIAEIKRILKPGGLLIVTTPQTMKNHSQAIPSNKSPYNNYNHSDIPNWHNDFFRFTKFGLITLFQDFTILNITESNGYFGSLHQLVNYFFASFRKDTLFIPIYFINNLLGVTLDYIAIQTKKLPWPFAQKFYYFTYSSLTINLIMVAKNKNND